MPVIEAGTPEAISRAQAGGKAKAANRARNASVELREIQGYTLQKLREETLTASEIAQLTRGYVEAEKLRRIIEGKPANVSQTLRPEAPSKKQRQSTGLVLEYEPPKPVV